LIIPLDTTSNNDFALRAYGLVYQLLRNGVPVQWAIRHDKKPSTGLPSDDTTDFAIPDLDATDPTATVLDLGNNVAVSLPSKYHGGPFIIDATNSATARPIIDKWLTDNPNPVTVVHRVTGTFKADIAKTLTVAPRIAVLDDGKQQLAFDIFKEAGIQDSKNQDWTDASPDVLSQDAIANPTTTQPDRGLFDASGTSKYCHLTSMHYDDTDSATTTKVVQQVRLWLTKRPGNHAFMQCLAIATFENNDMYGHFLTPKGVTVNDLLQGFHPAPGTLTNHSPAGSLTQVDG